MQRIACVLVLAAACSGSGYTSGEATLSPVTPTAKSAYAKSFVTDTDKTMGWTVEFIDSGPGTDCMDEHNNVVASIGIYTKQVDDGKHNGAMLATGDVFIV